MSISETRIQSEPSHGLLEDNAAKSIQFRSTLIGIQSKPLSPENIDTYAEDALVGLVNLTVSITDEYRMQNPLSLAPDKELEDSAYVYFGLDNLGEILNFVGSKATEIRHIGELIERAENIGLVLVPPQEQEAPAGSGNGSFEKKSIIPRTKTLLFILANDFDVDLDDPEQVSIKTGVLSDNMMRGLSYLMINVSGLDRTILCCDEEGNVTYVFDNRVLKDHGISPEELTHLTKSDINDLIASNITMGKRIVYTNKFVPRMIGLITDLQAELKGNDPQGFYLVPNAPEGVSSYIGISRNLGLSSKKVYDEIKKLGDRLGNIARFRFNTRIGRGFTPAQQEIIRQHLSKKGLLVEKPPEGIVSAVTLARSLGITYQTTVDNIEKIRNLLGPLGIYKFLGTKAEGFTPEQQGMIAKYFESKGLLSRSAPEGVLSAKSIARNLDIDPELLRKEIANMGSPLGEVQSFKFGSRITEGYTTEQQEIIEKYLRKRGMLIEVSGDRIVSVSSFAQELGINPQTVASAYKKLRGVLGPMTSYRFINGSSVSGLNTEQQEKIKIHLAGRHIFARNAPEGVLSVKNLAKRLKVNPDVLRIEVKAISDLLGDVEYFKFNSIRAVGYTPEQQEMIAQMLRERGLIS